jgi:peptide deformylase
MDLKLEYFGSDALRRKAKRVESVDATIRQLASNMLGCMYAEQGVGLAAEQVGKDVAMCVIDVPDKEACGVAMPLVLINPEVVAHSGEQVGQEGCLSFPGIFINVSRAEDVEVAYVNLEGKACKVQATGLLSRALQHEIDHLNGVLLVDHMTAVQKVANSGRLKRLKKGILPK